MEAIGYVMLLGLERKKRPQESGQVKYVNWTCAIYRPSKVVIGYIRVSAEAPERVQNTENMILNLLGCWISCYIICCVV